MDNRRRIVLRVSPELFGRFEARARTEKRASVTEWVLWTVIGATLPPPDPAFGRALDELRALRIAREMMDGGTPHAAHP